MKERVFCFGPRQSTVGILAEPDAQLAIAGAPTVLLWNVGINHRVGPFRFNVDLARQLAARGISSLRFDLSGLGDSPPRSDSLADRQRAILDLREAMAALRERKGVRQFALVGFCSGVDQAHEVALLEPDVAAAAFIEGYSYRTRGFWLRYPLRFLGLPRWNRLLLERRSTWLGAKQPAPTSVYRREYPPPEKFRADIGTMISRGTRLLFAFASDTEFNHAGQLASMIGAEAADRVELAYLPDADHTFYRASDRARVIDRLLAFAAYGTSTKVVTL